MIEHLGPEAALALPGVGFLLGCLFMVVRNTLAELREREKRFRSVEIGIAVRRLSVRDLAYGARISPLRGRRGAA